jgi:hypothetical protein
MKNNIDPQMIAEEFVNNGLIPAGTQGDFVEGLSREIRREVLRFGSDIAKGVVKTAFALSLKAA